MQAWMRMRDWEHVCLSVSLVWNVASDDKMSGCCEMWMSEEMLGLRKGFVQVWYSWNKLLNNPDLFKGKRGAGWMEMLFWNTDPLVGIFLMCGVFTVMQLMQHCIVIVY